MIPLQLRGRGFRFYKACGKKPAEKGWQGSNNYLWDDPGLALHVFGGGNYGVLTGKGGLVVLDFDCQEYYESVKERLMPTFTVLSAGKRLPHLYYWLNDPMFKKLNVRDGDDNVLCDVQALGAGVIGPGSTFNGRMYDVVSDTPVNPITLPQLDYALDIGFKLYGGVERNTKDYTSSPGLVEHTITILEGYGVERTGNTLFKCPFHTMGGKGNLSILPSGGLYCFHTQTFWWLDQFIKELRQYRDIK